ncbi:MAG: hypothetical protein Q8R08_05085 [bacterium]|nr:hypothetical protein [bacterium]
MHRQVHFPYWLIIILLAAFAVGYWVWTESLHDENIEYGILNIERTSPSTTLGTTGDIANWQTYRNEEYGFEVKYPGDSFIEQNIYSGGLDLIIRHHPSLDILITANGSLSRELSSFFGSKSSGSVQFGGKEGELFISESDCDGPGCEIASRSYAIKINHIIYSISFLGDTELNPIEGQILSTFTFIE